ncbi:hypothetical protein BDZ45DRAFT_669346 [Acephala macrosclerotiorum]|nr:hypothetical protein BDZ45DRAFT_669346 [Acephala macrosclerotiorum]
MLHVEACREARDEGYKLKLPFFQVGQQHFSHQSVRDYMNWDEDIIWILDDSCFAPDPVTFYCSQCPLLPESLLCLFSYSMQISHPCDCDLHKPPRLGGIAYNYDKWEDPTVDEDGEWIVNSIESLWYFRVRNLYIVVNHTHTIQDRDVVFVKPPWWPELTLADIELRDLGSLDRGVLAD